MELRSAGAPAEFAFPPADHLALGASLGLLDFDAGASPAAGWSTRCCERLHACTVLTAHHLVLETAPGLLSKFASMIADASSRSAQVWYCAHVYVYGSFKEVSGRVHVLFPQNLRLTICLACSKRVPPHGQARARRARSLCACGTRPRCWSWRCAAGRCSARRPRGSRPPPRPTSCARACWRSAASSRAATPRRRARTPSYRLEFYVW